MPHTPLLLLAPHIVWPARNGADITHDELASSLSKSLPYVDVVGAREVVRYSSGEPRGRRSHGGEMRPSVWAALRTILRGSNYYIERFNSSGFREEATRCEDDDRYGAILYSYLTTSSLSRYNDSRSRLVWSHNDEFKWFEDLGSKSVNPLGKLVARLSLRWLHRYLARRSDSLTLLHVTEADAAGWLERVPHHRYAVIPIGVARRGVAPALIPGRAPRLLFVGALGIRMNLDALQHFADTYEPALRRRFGKRLHVDIAGSSPLPEVSALCDKRGWHLHPNLSDDAMDALFMDAVASILPFNYSTGAKLKLLKSLSYGVPVLATPAVEAQADLISKPSLISDDPEAWAENLARLTERGVDVSTRNRLRALTDSHTWDASAERILEVIADLNETEGQ
ncbi:hypothetical protein BH23BAC4_BH23BAC4_02960 [soil metagenome]